MILETKQLEKTYTQNELSVKAVNGVNLSVDKGEFTAVVGPSGSGKTTLFNMLGGLDTPTAGSISVGGEIFSNMSAKQLTNYRLRNIGFVFQAYNLIPVLTAAENIAFVMELQGVAPKERQERAMELLEAVGLAEKAKMRPKHLSGGQQQRIAVARALASKPKFILADEPTANLDSHTTSDLLEIMEKLNKQEQITFLFSTHDQRVVDKARRVITLVDGQIVDDKR